ncbi:hypothetical protein [Desulfogranum marinum]|uniref:hypothetical protein n=1 Tax=Desulfogranum marinum TaxID=453220 RepID=UPI0029C8A3C8|nr:hypothetical protein [Desulfogranum marinum]
MRLSDTIFLAISKKIDVHINLKYFRFQTGGKSLTLNTYLYIEKKKENWSIDSVGKAPHKQGHTQKNELFRGPAEVCKFHALAAFLAYAIAELTGKRAMVKPTINCYGSQNLNSVLNGYEEGVLIRAFEDAGALQVNIKANV